VCAWRLVYYPTARVKLKIGGKWSCDARVVAAPGILVLATDIYDLGKSSHGDQVKREATEQRIHWIKCSGLSGNFLSEQLQAAPAISLRREGCEEASSHDFTLIEINLALIITLNAYNY